MRKRQRNQEVTVKQNKKNMKKIYTLIILLLISTLIYGQIKPLISLKHKKNIFAFEISQKNNILITAGSENIIFIWDLESGELKKQIFGHTSSVSDINLSDNEDNFISGSMIFDGTIKLWNCNNFAETKSIKSGLMKSNFLRIDTTQFLAYGIENNFPDGNIYLYSFPNLTVINTFTHSTPFKNEKVKKNENINNNKQDNKIENCEIVLNVDFSSGHEMETVNGCVFNSKTNEIISVGGKNILFWKLRENYNYFS